MLSLQLADTSAAAAFALAAVAPGDAGAIAYDQAAYDAAQASGIDPIAMDQFLRATSQAMLALGLPPYGAINVQNPGPVTTATVAAVSSPTTIAPSTAAAPSGSLPFTGSGTVPVWAGIAIVLIASGLLFAGARRRVTR